jgi:hypothetical protein
MGNQQSNENTKKKINVYVGSKHKKGTCLTWFDFVRKETNASFIRFYVEDKANNNPIFYEDGKYKYIDLANSFPYSELGSGLHLDLNYIFKYEHTKTFSVEEI